MTYTELRLACPGRNHASHGGSNITWTHYRCGGVIEIDEYADLRCRRCGKESNIFRWGFDCGQTTDDRFQLPSIDLISAVLACATEVTDKMGIQWYRRLLQNLIDSSE